MLMLSRLFAQIVVWIPKNACLTKKTSSFGAHLDSRVKQREKEMSKLACKGYKKGMKGIPQNTLLVMCFIHERSKRDESRYTLPPLRCLAAAPTPRFTFLFPCAQHRVFASCSCRWAPYIATLPAREGGVPTCWSLPEMQARLR